MRIDWTSGVFSNYYIFFVQGKRMGRMDKNVWSRTAELEWNDERFIFRGNSLFGTRQSLCDLQGIEILNISNKFLSNRSVIQYGDEVLLWRFKDVFGSKWELTRGETVIAAGTSNFTSGCIDFFQSDQYPVALVLSALHTFYAYSITILIFITILMVIFL